MAPTCSVLLTLVGSSLANLPPLTFTRSAAQSSFFDSDSDSYLDPTNHILIAMHLTVEPSASSCKLISKCTHTHTYTHTLRTRLIYYYFFALCTRFDFVFGRVFSGFSLSFPFGFSSSLLLLWSGSRTEVHTPTPVPFTVRSSNRLIGHSTIWIFAIIFMSFFLALNQSLPATPACITCTNYASCFSFRARLRMYPISDSSRSIVRPPLFTSLLSIPLAAGCAAAIQSFGRS